MRKPASCICEKGAADQQRLCTYQCFPLDGERADSHGELDNFEKLGSKLPPMSK